MHMSFVEKAFYGLCRRVDSPVSLGLWLRYRDAPSEYAEASIDPLAYDDPVRYDGDYACLAFLRKYAELKTGYNTVERAIHKFGNCEERCEQTNRSLSVVAITGRLARTEHAILRRAQELLATIWGSPQFDQIFGRCGWGPGSTASLKGAEASREHKMSQFPISITPLAVPYFKQVIRHDLLWLRHLFGQDVVGPVSLLDSCFTLTTDSRMLTVPKDARTDRVIFAEPTANVYLQKGVGGYIRSRLKRYGVDLDDQSRNQELARLALSQGLATLDLAAASDTISKATVRLLCPPDMYEVINALRSPSYGKDGASTKFHKFSSMGNGFTFELESLIFYCTARAVCEIKGYQGPIGVYGDDIIVPAEAGTDVVIALEDLGFEVNKEKSFFAGQFYESCGKHYFSAVDVTPFYQKHAVNSDLELARALNRIADWIRRDEYNVLNRGRFIGFHNDLVRSIPNRLRQFLVPNWVQGDGVIRTFLPMSLRYSINHGTRISYMKPKPPRRFLADGGAYADLQRRRSDELRSVCERPVPSLDPLRQRVPCDRAEDGFLDLRPKGRVSRYTIQHRWVQRWETESIS